LQLVQKTVKTLSLFNNIKQKSRPRERDERVAHVPNPVDRWLSVWVSWKVVELDAVVVSEDAHFCLLRVR
jgi:hypothetical protein